MSDNEPPFETVTVAKLEVEPGDFLVVQSQDQEQAQAVKEHLEALFPAANVVIVSAGVSLSVVRQIDRHRDCVTRTELEKMLAPEMG